MIVSDLLPLISPKTIQASCHAHILSRFFRNLCPTTPVILDFFANPANHEFLISHEPILCYTLLTISSHYHKLPSSKVSSRGYFIHPKAWQIILDRVLWAQEHGSASKLRTLGTVQAVLLLTEWPPRMVYLPPDDANEILAAEDDNIENTHKSLNFEDAILGSPMVSPSICCS
jgi:hypothetical protein